MDFQQFLKNLERYGVGKSETAKQLVQNAEQEMQDNNFQGLALHQLTLMRANYLSLFPKMDKGLGFFKALENKIDSFSKSVSKEAEIAA